MKIIRKDGIEYERKPKDIRYDKQFNIRMSSNDLEKLQNIANEEELPITTLAREILQEYISKYEV